MKTVLKSPKHFFEGFLFAEKKIERGIRSEDLLCIVCGSLVKVQIHAVYVYVLIRIILLYLLPKLRRDLRVLIRDVMDLIVLAPVRSDRVRKLVDDKRRVFFWFSLDKMAAERYNFEDSFFSFGG